MLKYRPEIDGLRALSVIAVIIYHAQINILGHQLLPGGYLGVDVFFVISGFLITSLIQEEFKTKQKFSLLHFYKRRLRRLMPALLSICFLTLPIAWFYLLPLQFVDFSKSLLGSLFFVSNFHWLDTLPVYGADPGELRLLLHTWSLAVEEQFYIFYPLLLIPFLGKSKTKLIATLFALFSISLITSHSVTTINSPFSFYMLPTRLWEILAGGLLASFPYTKLSPRYEHIFSWLGLFIILVSFCIFGNNSYHPGLPTLLPVTGALLLIFGTSGKNAATQFLSNKIFVSIGLLSYSLYLLHYPVFVFFRYNDWFNSTPQKLIAVFLSCVLALLSYKLIENPLRYNKKISDKSFFVGLIFSLAVLVFACFYIIANKGLPQRTQSETLLRLEQMRELRSSISQRNYMHMDKFTIDKISVEVIGSSWAREVADALLLNDDFEVGYRPTGHICAAITLPLTKEGEKDYVKNKEACRKNKQLFNRDFSKAQIVIIADHKTFLDTSQPKVTNELLENIKTLRSSGFKGPVLLITNKPMWKKLPTFILQTYGISTAGLNSFVQKDLRVSLAQMLAEDTSAKAFYKANGAYYYSLVSSLCQDKICPLLQGAKPLYFDFQHLTKAGIERVSEDLAPYLKSLISE